jgi:hypothetical protein
MNGPAPSSSASRQINWLHVSTVVSAAILIAAEVFGAAFAGGWAVAILFNLGGYSHYILQALFSACGLAVMIAFLRSAQRIEPFTSKK